MPPTRRSRSLATRRSIKRRGQTTPSGPREPPRILGLQIQALSVKPLIKMRTLSKIFKVTVVMAIGVTSIFTYRAFAKKPDTLSGAPIKRNWNAKKLKFQYQDDDGTKFKALLDANEAILIP